MIVLVGNITATERVEIQVDGVVEGDVHAPRLVVADGATLNGWTTHGGRYDGNARWTVEDGAIVGRQGPNRAGGLLYTDIKRL